MEAIDYINREYGKGATGLAAAGLPGGEGNLGREWTMKRQKRSPRSTTQAAGRWRCTRRTICTS